jgi:hypothetical protein
MPEREQRNINPAALPDFHSSSGDNVLFCPLSVRYLLSAFVHGDFKQTREKQILLKVIDKALDLIGNGLG